MVVCSLSPLLAADNSAVKQEGDLIKVDFELHRMGKALGVGLAVSGVAAGIGVLGAATVEALARQPEASDNLLSAMNTGVYACVGLAMVAIITTYFF